MNHPSGDQHWTRRKPEHIKRGAESHAAKLSPADIEVIRGMDKNKMPPGLIAAHFGVSRVTIWRQLKALGLR